MKPRYAWVLAGYHKPAAVGAETGPRTEFQAFLERFGGALLSRSRLLSHPTLTARVAGKFGQPLLGLAHLVHPWAKDVDAIIASGEDIGVPIALASLYRRSRTPIHMMFHGHHLQSRKLRLLAPILRRMRHVHFHCLSRSLAEWTMAVLGIPADRCHATGYGIDTDFFAGGTTGDTPLIASAGAANRDYATLAEAVRDLPVTVKIAADSTWVPPIPNSTEAGWPANVSSRSYGDYQRLRELYQQAQFVVVPLHPARHACGYAVIAEALAMGRGVIATRTDVPPDFLIPDETGAFVVAHDAVGLRNAITAWLDNPQRAATMGRQARALMVAQFSLSQYCERLEAIVAVSVNSHRLG